MTEQEMFDKAYLGVMAQGKPSMDKNGTCLYRHPDGLKCGVGQIMTDDEYRPQMDDHGHSVSTMFMATSFDVPVWLIENREFLAELQAVHDSSSFDEDDMFLPRFNAEMKAFAKSYSLTVPSLPEAPK